MTHMHALRFFNRFFPEILHLKTMATALFLGLGFSWPLALHSAKLDQESSEMPATFRQEEAQPWCAKEDPKTFCFLTDLVSQDLNTRHSGRFLMTQEDQNSAVLSSFFPEDLIVHILSFVPSDDLRAVCCTATGLKRFVQTHDTLNHRKTLHTNLHKWNFDNSGVHFPVPANSFFVRQNNFEICFDYPIGRSGFTHLQQLAYQEAAAKKMSQLLSMPLKDAWPFFPTSLQQAMLPISGPILLQPPCFFGTTHGSFSVSIRFSSTTLPTHDPGEGPALAQATLEGFFGATGFSCPKVISVFFPQNAYLVPYLSALLSPLKHVCNGPFCARYFFQAPDDADLKKNHSRTSFWYFYKVLAHVLTDSLLLAQDPKEQDELVKLKHTLCFRQQQYIDLIYRNPDGQQSLAKMKRDARISPYDWTMIHQPNRV